MGGVSRLIGAIRTITATDVVVCLWLVFCVWLLANRAPPLPTVQSPPSDSVRIAKATVLVVEDPLSIWFGPLTTPWFRYVPQSIALWLFTVAGIAEGGFHAASVINAAYALVMEVFVAPLVLYVAVTCATDRRVGVVMTVLYGIALLTTPVVSLESVLGWTGVCTTCRLQPTGPLWSYSDHWQYAWTMPFVVGTIASTHRAVQSRLGGLGPLVVGVLLGAVIGLHFALAVVCASILASIAVVRLVHDGRQALHETVLGLSVTAFLALPNLPIVIQTWHSWWVAGQRRLPFLSSIESAITSLSPGTIVAILIGATMMAAGLITMAAQAWHQPQSSYHSRRNTGVSRRSWLVRHDTFCVWGVISASAYAVSLVGGREWLQSLLASTLLGALCLWCAIALVGSYGRFAAPE